MKNQKKLIVTAKYGSLEFSETAWPYAENAYDEQVEDCIESIRQLIIDVGIAEMMDVFQIQQPQIVEVDKGPSNNTTEALARAINQS